MRKPNHPGRDTFRGDLFGLPSHRLDAQRMEQIARTVAEDCGISYDQIRSDARPDFIALPRLLAYWLQAEATGANLDAIGRWWGKTHGTVHHGIEAMRARFETVPAFRAFTLQLKTKLDIVP